MNQGLSAGAQMSHSHLRRHRIEKLEESVKRLSMSQGVLGVMVTTETWNVIDSTFDHILTKYWKRQIKFLEDLGIAAVRDSDPKNDLQFLRVQSKKYEILLSIAKDHRVLVLFSSSSKDPLKISIQRLRQMKTENRELKQSGKRIRMAFDPCRPHTKLVGGKEKVIITEKIDGNIVDQKDDINTF